MQCWLDQSLFFLLGLKDYEKANYIHIICKPTLVAPTSSSGQLFARIIFI